MIAVVAIVGAELAWRAVRVGADRQDRRGTAREPTTTPAPAPAGTTNLRADYRDGLLDITWKPPEGSEEILVLVSPDAYLGGGLVFTSKDSATMMPAWKYQGRLSGKATRVVVAPPQGALYFISVASRVATDWPGAWPGADMMLTIPATATVTVATPAAGRVGRVLLIEGTLSVPPGALPARGAVRVLADLKNPKTGRWALVREERSAVTVGRAVGARSTFRQLFRPDRAGWWRFRLIPTGEMTVGMAWARVPYATRAVRVR